MEQISGSLQQDTHQFDIAMVKHPVKQIPLAEIVGGKQVERNIDAILLEIARNILPEVGQLESGASEIGERLPLVVVVAAEIKHKAPHRIRRVTAIRYDGIPRGIAMHRLVLAKRGQQIRKRRDGNVESVD